MSAPEYNITAERAFPTPYSNSTLLPLLLMSLARQKHTPDTSASFKYEYDYIIIGAGSAGSVVAARLSEVSCASVLLLEAGPSPPKLTDIVSIVTSFWSSDIGWAYKTAPQKYASYGQRNRDHPCFSEIPCVSMLLLEAGPPPPKPTDLVSMVISFWSSDIDWTYKAPPQKYASYAQENRQVEWPSGKTLGGSSVINGGLYVRGNMKDYDDWASMGAEGWSYKEVLPYFKKLEDNKDILDEFHGVGGPVTVMRPRYDPEIKLPISLAAEERGYKFVDPDGQNQTGFYDIQDTMRDSQRCSTAKAYLVPANDRENLDILTNAMVEKIIIQNSRAIGVQFAIGRKIYFVKAKQEVILSAGAINSAQILMLSGIGPKEELLKFNIPVHADLPVGEDLQDHSAAVLNFVLKPQIQPFIEKLLNPENIQRYIDNRTGPLAAAAGIITVAFLFEDQVNPEMDYPNYQLNFLESAVLGRKELYNLKDEVYQQVYAPYENVPIMTCVANNLHPRSRGKVTLRSANPYDSPIIDPNYLSDPLDVKDIVQGLKKCREIGNSDSMMTVVSEEFQTLYPGCETFVDNEDRYFECVARSETISLSHESSTAKMGDPCDPKTVVDPQLRVKNIRGLRVVDNSVMPKIISGNTNVPAIMIGEKASDMIKETIRCDSSNSKILERLPMAPHLKICS